MTFKFGFRKRLLVVLLSMFACVPLLAKAGTDSPFPMIIHVGDVIYQDAAMMLVVERTDIDAGFSPLVHVVAIDPLTGTVLFHGSVVVSRKKIRFVSMY